MESDQQITNMIISNERRQFTQRAINKLLGINIVSFTLSVFNEAVIGHSALGFAQASMELTDTVLAKGLTYSEKNDAQGKHLRASRQRQALYSTHVVTASIGIVEGIRLIGENSEPKVGNMVVAGIVGAVNTHFIYHKRKHLNKTAHVTMPTHETAFSDPIEVVQDELMDLPSPEAVHAMNENGTTAIALTNLVESGGGLLGPLMQYFSSQGSAAAAIASSAGVIGIMGRQIYRERNLSIT